MSTSYHDGLVDFADALYGNDEDPVDAVVSRDGVANGLLHAADQMAQVRINWVGLDTGVANGQNTYITTDVADPTADLWYYMGSFEGWPLTLHADGTPYKLRIRLAAAAAGGSGNCRIRVVIAPTYPYALANLEAPADSIWESNDTTSSTPAWLGGLSQGSEADLTLVTVTRSEARSWTQLVNVHNAVGGADPSAVTQVLVGAYIFGLTENSNVPRLHALHLSEYVGT